MTLGILFWVLMLLWLIFGMVAVWPKEAPPTVFGYAPFGGTLLHFILLLILGWKVLGAPVQ